MPLGRRSVQRRGAGRAGRRDISSYVSTTLIFMTVISLLLTLLHAFIIRQRIGFFNLWFVVKKVKTRQKIEWVGNSESGLQVT